MYISTIQPYAASLISFSVDKDGFVLLSVIGRSVREKNRTQVIELIKVALTNILSQPVVSVKLANRYVSVLGKTSKNSGIVEQKIQLLKYCPDLLYNQPVLDRMLTMQVKEPE